MITQETFDKIVHGIIAQGGAAIGDEGVCQFRAENGRKCAAGQLIPDDKYFYSFEESGSVLNPPVWDAIGLPVEQQEEIRSLQGLHDECAIKGIDGDISADDDFFEKWIPKMQEWATANGLIFTRE